MLPFPKPAPAAAVSAPPSLPGELAVWLAHALGADGARRGGCGTGDEARDAVLRALAQRFYPCVPVSTQAERIYTLAEAYAFLNWPRDRDRAQIPASYGGTPDEYLWAAFKSGARMPIAMRELRRVLIGVGQDGD